LRSNLLSVGQLEENGYNNKIQNGICEIFDRIKEIIATVKKSSNRLYPLKIESIQTCLMAKVKDHAWLWHFCYGHLSFGVLTDSMTKEYSDWSSLNFTPSKVCEECVAIKQPHSQFPKGKSCELMMFWSWRIQTYEV